MRVCTLQLCECKESLTEVRHKTFWSGGVKEKVIQESVAPRCDIRRGSGSRRQVGEDEPYRRLEKSDPKYMTSVEIPEHKGSGLFFFPCVLSLKKN